MKLRNEQKGMSPLIIILLILLLAVVGFAGWTVYNTNKKAEPSASSSAAKTAETKKSTTKRVEPTYVKPPSEDYRVALPATWMSSTCPDSPDLLFLAPSADKIGKCNSEYAGTVIIAKNAGNTGHNEAFYTGDAYYGGAAYGAVTIDGIAGYKVSYTVVVGDGIGIGPADGSKIVEYSLYDGTETFTLMYTRAPGEPDLTAVVQTLAESFDKL